MPPDDRRSLSLRLSLLQYLIATVFAALAVGFWVFQVAQYEEFLERAANNHERRLPLRAPRGVLFDRHGEILVANQDTFNIALVREHVKDLDRTLRLVAEATGVDEAVLREKVERRRRDPIYRPIVLIENATFAQVAAIKARRLELPGVIDDQVPTRRYPDDALAAHLFGYVSEVREEQLNTPEFEGVGSGDIVGQAGVERAYNSLLRGVEGNRAVVVNSVGREIALIGEKPPVEGRRLQLTLDADLQRAAEEGFKHFGEVQSGGPYNGAAVVLDPRSGEVLTFVSRPAFDPNKFAVGIDRVSWSSYLNDTLRPLQNRALQGTYSPGSTFKIVIATAALEEGLVTPDFTVHCAGSKFFYTRSFACHLKGGHGTLNMRNAIEKSCNVYFYTLGQMLGVDRIHKWASLLGLGEKSGIELPNEVPGLVPSSEWKLRTLKEKWYPGETISVAIGQGQVNVTPLQLAVMMMTVANGGTRHTPHLVKAIDNGDGKGWQPVDPPAPKSTVHMKDSTVQALHDGLWMVVNAAGTGGRARLAGRDISGKTGTAQVISLTGAQKARGKIEVRDHGWFVFFAPRDNPELAGVVFTEHSEHGYYGGPIIKHIVDTYYAKKEGRPLPTLEEPGTVPTAVTTATAAATPPVANRPGGRP